MAWLGHPDWQRRPTDWKNGQGAELISGELDEPITTSDDHDEWYRLVVPWPQERCRTQGTGRSWQTW